MADNVSLFIVRHGQTEFNLTLKAQGWCDSPLTEKGAKDALILGRGFKRLNFDRIYSSDLGRANETAQLILKGMDSHMPISTDRGLRERGLGSLEGRKYYGNVLDKAEEHAKSLGFTDKYDFPYLCNLYDRLVDDSSIEPFDTFIQRINDTLNRIGQESAGCKNILIISHGFSIMAMTYIITGARYVESHIPNLSVTQVSYSLGAFTLVKQNDMSYYKSGMVKD